MIENEKLERVDDRLIWTQFKVWTQFKAGDRTAFSKLMQMYHQDMLGFETKFTEDKEFIKDCLQELFLEKPVYHK